MSGIILMAVITIAIVGLIVTLVSRYKKCPSDKLLVVFGRVGSNKDGGKASAKTLRGGGAFIWPVIQGYGFLDLKPMTLDVDLTGALSIQNIRVDVPSTFTISISGEENIKENASEKLLGLGKKEIEELARDIIFGQLRLVVSQMTIEELNTNRDKFLGSIKDNLEDELIKVGLKLINVNIKDIKDESGYIEALGQENASQAINEAKKSVAEKNKDGAIGVAEASREERVSVANSNNQAEIGEAKAEQLKRVDVSEANASAVEGENKAKITVAESTAEKEVAEANARKLSETAQKVADANVLKDSYKSEKDAETARAERDKASYYADEIVPAETAKQKIEIQAEAQAEQTRKVAKGEADAVFMKMDAEARGTLEIMSKQAKGFKEQIAAAGSADNSVKLAIVDKLETLYDIQSQAIKGIKIDKLTVWESGNGGGKGGGNSTSNFVEGFMKSFPGYKDVFTQAGVEMPAFLQGAGEKEAEIIKAHKNPENGPTKELLTEN